LRTVVTLRITFAGDTATVARAMTRMITRVRRGLRGSGPALVVAGGETTVRLGVKSGKGGRNQALAAAMASALDGTDGVALLAAGTDGIDGPTDAAGAFADGSSARRALRTSRDLPDALDRHDVYPTLAALGDLFRPGPTGTNVADLVIALVWKDRGWRLPRRVIPSARQ
jgi:glycerate 2-kinase